MTRSPLRIALFALIVFLSSALVLVLEIVAARLIAPFVGVSLYSWTAIIGVILAGLSLGNWLGGVWADRGARGSSAGLALVLAGLSAFAIILLLPRVSIALQASDFSLAAMSVVLTGALFFLPAALLGIVTPLLTTLALQGSTRTGHIVGLMHALAALGSIVGTFVTGFWLIQWIGSRNLVIATGVVLVLLALPLFHRGRDVAASAVAGGLGVLFAISTLGYADPCQRESNYFCLRVVDSTGEVPFGTARSLVLDHLLHGTNHKEAPELISAPYLHLIDELAERQLADHRQPARYFFLGGGAYTMPRAVLARHPEAEVAVAELDPTVTEMARDELFVDTTGMRVLHMDARAALQRQPSGAYDVIVGDVFHDITVPYHLLTREFAELVADRLDEGGIYAINMVDSFPRARMVEAVYRTLSSVFPEVDVWIDQLPTEPTRVTYVLHARQGGPALPDRLAARHGMPREWFRVTEPISRQLSASDGIPLLTDDYAPVERLVAQLFLGGQGR
jgi:predicted membrane-bound spermidine synthase